METDLQTEQDPVEINPFQTNAGIKLIKSMSFEIKVVSIVNIISGILISLSFFGALVGVPMIISSVKAIDSANQFSKFSANLSADSLYKAISSLRTYFRIQFWVFVIGFVILAIVLIAFATFLSSFINEIKDSPIFS